jgi:hypothetical protein
MRVMVSLKSFLFPREEKVLLSLVSLLIPAEVRLADGEGHLLVAGH